MTLAHPVAFTIVIESVEGAPETTKSQPAPFVTVTVPVPLIVGQDASAPVVLIVNEPQPLSVVFIPGPGIMLVKGIPENVCIVSILRPEPEHSPLLSKGIPLRPEPSCKEL